MSVKVKCAKCSSVVAVNPRVLGSSIACPHCDFKFTLPSAADYAQFQKSQAERLELVAKNRMVEAPRVKVVKRKTPVAEVAKPEFKVPAVKRRPKREHSRGTNHDEAWDITPMVDVVFLLLIFFMLTASFSIQKVIRTGRQQSDKPSRNVRSDKDPENAGVIVQVDEFNGYAVVSSDDREEVASKQDLIVALNRLKDASSGDEMETLTVQAHEESTHGAVVGALDAGRAAKFNRFKTVMVDQF